MNICPGQGIGRTPKIELFTCPRCGNPDVEIFTCDHEGKCQQCGLMVSKIKVQSCVDWCKSAKECLAMRGIIST